jgi:hypothetical protein
MKRFVFVSVVPVMLISVLILSSCSTEGNKEITITDIGWIYENIDTSFWTDGFDDATLFFTFYLVYEGSRISAEDVEYAVFNYQDSIYWPFPLEPGYFYPADRLMMSYRSYSTAWSGNGSVLPIGPINFEVELTNGYYETSTFVVPAPGSTSTDGKAFVYNENFSGPVPGQYTPMIRRASISSSSKTSTVDITFSVSDSNVFNGDVWFYDAAGGYIGASVVFRDWVSGDVSAVMNGGSGLYVDGSANSVQLAAGDITFESGYDFTDIKSLHLVLTDGFQYLGEPAEWDCRSISVRRYL